MIDINFISPTGGIVKSVNGKTGRVELTARDIGAATEEYVAKKIAEAELSGSGVDLNAYYTKSETDNAIKTAVDAIEIPQPDLTNYATKSYVSTQIALNKPDLTDYAKKSEIPSTVGLASETYVNEQIAKIPATDLSNYYTKAETNKAIDDNMPDMNLYATKTYVTNEIAKINIPETDLSNYYNKQEVDAKIPDTSGFLTEVPAEYITETELEQALADIPTGGGSVAVDGTTIIQNADGTISTAAGGGRVLVGEPIEKFNKEYADGVTNYANNYSVYAPLGTESEGNAFINALNADRAATYQVYIEFRNATTGDIGSCTGTTSYSGSDWITSDLAVFDDVLTKFYITSNYGLALFSTKNASETYQIYYITKLVVSTLPKYEYTTINSNFLNIGDGLSVQGLGTLITTNAGIVTDGNKNVLGGKDNYIYYNMTSSSYSPAVLLGKNNSGGGQGSAFIGSDNTVSGITNYTYLIGQSNSAGSYANYAFGTNNNLSVSNSYAFGNYNTITTSGTGYRFAIGDYNNIKKQYGFAAGRHLTVDSNAQCVYGINNIADSAATYNIIIGNSTDSNNKANGLTIDKAGNVAVQGTISNNGADYAEYFEWADGNPEGEDRVGLLVALDGNKIRLAQAGEEDVLGVISGTATVLGDDAEWTWQGRYLRDEFGRLIMEEVETFHEEEIRNEDGSEVIGVGTVSEGVSLMPKINPEYDASKPYVSRAKRSEWDAVGMMGKLFVRDDGTCAVNGYAAPAANGLVTAATGKTNMRVMERISDNIIKICLK